MITTVSRMVAAGSVASARATPHLEPPKRPVARHRRPHGAEQLSKPLRRPPATPVGTRTPGGRDAQRPNQDASQPPEARPMP
jgi:hypothetical protein